MLSVGGLGVGPGGAGLLGALVADCEFIYFPLEVGLERRSHVDFEFLRCCEFFDQVLDVVSLADGELAETVPRLHLLAEQNGLVRVLGGMVKYLRRLLFFVGGRVLSLLLRRELLARFVVG